MAESHEQHETIRESPSPIQADVFLSRHNGQNVIVKDFSKRPWLIRVLLLRPALRHEHKIMNQLQGVEGVPRLIGMEGDRLILEFVNSSGTLIGHDEMAPDAYPPLAFFLQLRQIVDTIHQRGVAHGDIRRRNILVAGDAPCLIDFGTGISTRGAFGFLRRALFRRIAVVDHRKALKLQGCYYPASLTREEQALVEWRSPLYRVLRTIKRRVIKGWLSPKRWRERLSGGRPQQSLYRDPPVGTESEDKGEKEKPCEDN